MFVMGVGGSVHDFSCCIVRDGEVIVAIEEERISREKHALGRRSLLLQGIDYCLEAAGCNLDDIDLIVSNDLFRFLPNTSFPFSNNVIRINHHMSHAAGAYFSSGFDECAILVSDGSGSTYWSGANSGYWDGNEEAMSFGYAKKNVIRIFERTHSRPIYIEDHLGLGYTDGKINPKSAGGFYSIMSCLIGFKMLQEGKTMGLAPYGDDKYINKIKEFIEVKDGYDYIYHTYQKSFFDFITDEMNGKSEDELFRVKADIAYAAQAIVEENLFSVMNHLHKVTKCDKLCFGGGVALNSVLNGKIFDNTPFTEVFIHPAAGDSGTSIGAALYGYHVIMKQPYCPNHQIKNVYHGKPYSSSLIQKAFEKNCGSISYEQLDMSKLLTKTAKDMSDGKIIAWFQGQSEMGPRALGNRSILVDPRRKKMKDIINSRVKFRESFRPFAPVVLTEYAKEYFEMKCAEIPFMLFVMDVLEDKRDIIPAVTHVDGSARVQTVSRENNPVFYDLIDSFYQITGVPVVLNTSFNIKGKPIVETPAEAISAFLSSDIDVLIVDDYYVTKN